MSCIVEVTIEQIAADINQPVETVVLQVQESEARALLNVKTPTIDALCAARGCSRDYLAMRIVENANNARNAGMYILSWQQETEEKIKTMTLEEFSAMWETIENKSLS